MLKVLPRLSGVYYFTLIQYLVKSGSKNDIVPPYILFSSLLFFLVKGPAADATDAPQPSGLLCNSVMKMISGMRFTRENRSTRGKSCPSATLSTIHPTWTDPGSNPGLRGETLATNRLRFLSYVTSYLLLSIILLNTLFQISSDYVLSLSLETKLPIHIKALINGEVLCI